jgi:hypothetical protein
VHYILLFFKISGQNWFKVLSELLICKGYHKYILLATLPLQYRTRWTCSCCSYRKVTCPKSIKNYNLAFGKVSPDPLETLRVVRRTQFENHCFRWYGSDHHFSIILVPGMPYKVWLILLTLYPKLSQPVDTISVICGCISGWKLKKHIHKL